MTMTHINRHIMYTCDLLSEGANVEQYGNSYIGSWWWLVSCDTAKAWAWTGVPPPCYTQVKTKFTAQTKKRSKLTSNLDTRLVRSTLGIENSKYSWQYFTVSILLAVKSFMKNLLMTKSSDCKSTGKITF